MQGSSDKVESQFSIHDGDMYHQQTTTRTLPSKSSKRPARPVLNTTGTMMTYVDPGVKQNIGMTKHKSKYRDRVRN